MTCPHCEQLRAAFRKSYEAAIVATSSLYPDPHGLRGKAMQLLDEVDVTVRKLAGHSPLQSVITWIPVSERLPGDRRLVLAVSRQLGIGIVYLAFHDSDVGTWHLPTSVLIVGTVTHWAELPPPPASEEETG